jgi:predicted nucleic acid-binding protein
VPPVLIDTNLLVYLLDQNEPSRQAQAQLVLQELEETQFGRLSVQNLGEFFSVVTRKLDPPLDPGQALNHIGLFARIWPIFDLTELIVLEAGRGVRDYSLAYYDAQLWASARLNQVPTIFSEDSQDGAVLDGVRFVNPFAPRFVLSAWL